MTRLRVSMALIAVLVAIATSVAITWLSHDAAAVVPLIDDLTPDDTPALPTVVTPSRAAIEAKAAVGPTTDEPDLPDLTLTKSSDEPAQAIAYAQAGTASLSVRASSTSGTPLAGVSIRVSQAEPGETSEDLQRRKEHCVRVSTGTDGRAVVHGLAEWPTSVSCTPATGFTWSELVVVVPQGQEIALVLQPIAEISGVVVGPDGAPVAGILVGPLGGAMAGRYGSASDASGRFCVSGPLGETVDLGVIGEKHVEHRADGVMERFSFDSRYRGQLHGVSVPASNLVLRLEAIPSDRALQVVVHDADGLPAPQVVVHVGATLDIPSGTTDAEGRVAFTGLRDEEVVIQAVPRDGGDCLWVASAPVKATPNGLSIELRLRRAATIAGIVLDPDGTPVWGDIVRASAADGESAAVTDATGRFHLTVALGVRYQLNVEHIADRQLSTTLSEVAAEGAEVVVRLGQR